MKAKIIQEFLNSDIKIKSIQKLEYYIDFCLDNRTFAFKGKTSHHHILPNILFERYSNLKENPWNGVHLKYSKHYEAHFYLTEAIDDYSQLHAFIAMHNKDIKSGKIEEKDLIPVEEFQSKMEERGRKHSEYLKEIIEIDGISQSRAKHNAKNRDMDYINAAINISKTKNSKFWKENKEPVRLKKWHYTMGEINENGISKTTLATNKMLETRKANGSYITGGKKTSNTKYKIQENGNTGHQNAVIKANKTKKEVDKYGKSINDYGAEKSAKTKNTINVDTGLTNAQEAGLKLSKTLRLKSKKYNVVHYEKGIIQVNVLLRDLPTQGLKNKTKENYFGKSDISRKRAIKFGVENYIGCYLEEAK